jgi:hypothetical protein
MPANPIEDLLGRAYPNPERIGCPGGETLRGMAENPPPLDDELSVHVWHCSPCFREFTAFRDAKRAGDRRVLRTKLSVGAMALCTGVALIAYWPAFHRNGPQSFLHTRSSEPAIGELDFRDDRSERGAGSNTNREQKLRSSVRVLLLALPGGSETGEYEIEIRSGSDIARTVRATRGVAARQSDGRIKLRCELGPDLLPPGSYTAAWRSRGSGLWHYGTFIVSLATDLRGAIFLPLRSAR